MTARNLWGGFGCWELPRHGPHRPKSMPQAPISQLPGPPPETPSEMDQLAAARAESAAASWRTSNNRTRPPTRSGQGSRTSITPRWRLRPIPKRPDNPQTRHAHSRRTFNEPRPTPFPHPQGRANVIAASGPGPRRYVSDTDCGIRAPIAEVVGHVPSITAANTCPECWSKIHPAQQDLAAPEEFPTPGEPARTFLASIDSDVSPAKRHARNRQCTEATALLAALAFETAMATIDAGLAGYHMTRSNAHDARDAAHRRRQIRESADRALQTFTDLEHVLYETEHRVGPAGRELPKEMKKAGRALLECLQTASARAGEEIDLLALRLRGH